MSIEEALLKNAEALNRHSEALNRQAAVMEQIAESGVAFVATAAQLPASASTTSGAKPAAAAEKPKTAAEKKAEKKAAEAAAASAAAITVESPDDDLDDDEGDPFAADEDEAKTYTTADIRALILKVRDKGGEKANAEGAKKVLAALGVKSMSEIAEDQYAKAAELCLKALK